MWEQYQRNGTVPQEMEYEESPRGRVMYNARTRQFTILADQCILKRKRWIKSIKKEMRLPLDTKIDGDSHYRCPACLYGSESKLRI